MLIIIGLSTAWDRWVFESLDGMGGLRIFRRNVIMFLTLFRMSFKLSKGR